MSIINQSARVDSKIGQYMLNGAEVQASHCHVGWTLRNYYATGDKWKRKRLCGAVVFGVFLVTLRVRLLSWFQLLLFVFDWWWLWIRSRV